jgi:CRP-like cAMP-binding protein
LALKGCLRQLQLPLLLLLRQAEPAKIWLQLIASVAVRFGDYRSRKEHIMNGPAPRYAILAALPLAVWERMRPDFELISLQSPDTLQIQGDRHAFAYFPTAGVISTISIMTGGDSVETATTGPEGMVPIGALLHSVTNLSQQQVQVSGEALAIPIQAFHKWKQSEESFSAILNAYSQAFMVQVLQSVGCNAVHSVEDRMARWLLTCHDRAHSDNFNLTQQFLSEMLGVTRPLVNSIARRFQRLGLITYARGELTIENRFGLEAISCECYETIREAYRQRSLSI